VSKEPLNILFLMPDQLRHDFLSCYGADFIETPHIDSIGEQGMRATASIAGSSARTSSR